MVGRSIENQYPPRVTPDPQAAEMLKVSGITTDKINNVSFAVRSGEILGLGGLVGAGRTETLRALFGCDPCRGEILKKGKKR